MAIKYRRHFDEIQACEVVKETAHYITFYVPGKHGTKRAHKAKEFSGYTGWHDTWEDAHAYLVAKQQERVDAIRQNLEREKGKLGQIKGMKKASGGEDTGGYQK
jgi:hypothetical protein